MLVELEGFAKTRMTFLKTHQKEVDATLGPEHILVERIFSLSVGGHFYLCWYTDQTDASPDVTESLNPIELEHVAF